MDDDKHAAPDGSQPRKSARKIWNHTTPVTFPAMFTWPPRPMDIVDGLLRRWVTLSRNLVFLLLAWLVFAWFTPEQSVTATFSMSWIVPLYLQNVGLMLVVAGGLHLYLFVLRAQGNRTKYDLREKLETGKRFTFGTQVRDNMFWSIVSGCTVWTLYHAVYLWGASNGVIPTFGFQENPLGFFLWLLVLPNIFSLHFYLIHRLLHWPPLYQLAHRLHHRNVHIGPWSGMSMHPVEHVLYISSVLVHFVIPSHPVIAIMHLYSRSLGPAFSHSGYEKLMAGDRTVMTSADFHHQLHHRFFECNYGSPDAPWDLWFGSLHDGSEAANAAVKRRRAAMYQGSKQAASHTSGQR